MATGTRRAHDGTRRTHDGADDDEPPLAYMNLSLVEQVWGAAAADSIRKSQRKWHRKHKQRRKGKD